MTPKFETLEFDIKQMLMGNHAPENLELKTDTAHRIVHLAKNIATHTLDIVNHKPREDKLFTHRHMRMSEIGEPCLRKLMYKWYEPNIGLEPYAERPEPYLPVKFTYGDYIEELTLFLAAESGHKVSHRQKEVELRPSGTEWYAVGHIDATIDEYVVDVKSAADVSFQKYKREGLTPDTDSFGYLWQIDGYAQALGTDKRAFIFTNKHDGSLHIINRQGEPLLDVGERIKSIGRVADDYLERRILPSKLELKVTKYGNQLPTVCSYCNFKYSCYDGNITGVINSSRPMYFDTTTLTKEGHDFIKTKAKIGKPPAFAKTEEGSEVPF